MTPQAPASGGRQPPDGLLSSGGSRPPPAPVEWLENLGRFTHFAARALLAALAAPARPGTLLTQFYQVLLGVLPLGLVAGLAVGAVLFLQLHGIFQRFEAEQYLPQAMALAVVLEFAPIGAGLILAGRAGASLGAELGSMRLTEQIDALETLGLSPLRYLVGPRVLACMLTMPLLTVFVAYLAIAAGLLGDAALGTMSARQYLNETVRVLTLQDALPAILKTVVFGYLIGVTGCYHGMTAYGGTEGVGRAATRGVVVSIVLVLVSDVVLVRVIQLLTGAG
jgi:phospholipid/cholesterol/gamma-HCH transport system permease protein